MQAHLAGMNVERRALGELGKLVLLKADCVVILDGTMPLSSRLMDQERRV